MTAIQPALVPTPLEDEADGPIAPTRFSAKFRHLFTHSLLFAIGTVLVAVSLFLAVFGPVIAPYDPIKPSSDVLVGPNGDHWFGTDSSGLDIFSRVICGARIDITIALLATAISVFVGSLIGLLASFSQGRVGNFVLRVSDVLQAFPLFVLSIIYVTAVGRSASNIVAVVAVFNIPIYIRLIRTQVVALRNRAFVEAARANGSRESWIAIRHVLPNSLSPAWAQASITLGATILVTAGLSYIGAGIRPPTPEWGGMISSGANGIVIGQWWMSVFPGLAMSLSVFGFAAFGNGMQKLVSS
jgi:peptide/nickel transport system permease protein